MKRTFQEDLDRAIAFHGHLCGGQIIGTRLSRFALGYFGIDDASANRDLIAFVEADRCLADAITIVADCHMGRRRLKWHDYGKMAVTFLNTATGEAIRLTTRNIKPGPNDDQVAFYQSIPDDELIVMQKVVVAIDQYDLPGKPAQTQVCEKCGERVHDNRHVTVDGQVLCKPCAGVDTYYRVME